MGKKQKPRVFDLRMDKAKAAFEAGDLGTARSLLDKVIGADSTTHLFKRREEAADRWRWEDAFALRSAVREKAADPGWLEDLVVAGSGGDWEQKARAITLLLERREYGRIPDLDYSFLSGTRDQHFTVKRGVALARLALKDFQKAWISVWQLWEYMKPTPEELERLHAEATALVGPGPTPEAAKALAAIRTRPELEKKARPRWPDAREREWRIWVNTTRAYGQMMKAGQINWFKNFNGLLYDSGPLAAKWPKNVRAYMNDSNKAHKQLFDDVKNGDYAKVCSARVVEFLRSQALKNVEFLPVQIIDPLKKVAAKDYCVVHPSVPLDALDHAAAGPHHNAIDKEQIDSVEALVLDHSYVDPEVRIFRLAGYHWAVFVEKPLADEMQARAFTGMDFLTVEKWFESHAR